MCCMHSCILIHVLGYSESQISGPAFIYISVSVRKGCHYFGAHADILSIIVHWFHVKVLLQGRRGQERRGEE